MADPPIGLTTDEAHRRLAKDGPNAIVDVTQHPVLRAAQKLWAPVPWMLEAAILLQLVLGDYVEAGVVALLLVFNAGLGFFQEGRAQATLNALKSRLALIAAVRRDGNWTTVPAAGLVAGDIVKLSLGTVVVADVHLLDGSILLDQSMLTGESIPVETGAGAPAYAGALVRRGEAVAEVTATGERTKFGRTAELVRTAKVESSQQKIVMGVVRNLALFNGAATILLAVYAYSLSLPDAEIMALVLVGLLSSIPVALPSMFTLAAAVGARSLAAQGVLPTSLSAVDEAAGVDILCSDKTGTLTRNELAVMTIRPDGWLRRGACSRVCGPDKLRRRSRSSRCRHPRRCHAQADRRCTQAGDIRTLRSLAETLRGDSSPGRRRRDENRQRRIRGHLGPVASTGERIGGCGRIAGEGIQSSGRCRGTVGQFGAGRLYRAERSAARRLGGACF
ncbi:MAG: HAD-IC family P-type ATPase [Rhizomicrobium sp.]